MLLSPNVGLKRDVLRRAGPIAKCGRNALKPECGIETPILSLSLSSFAVGMLLSPNVGLKQLDRSPQHAIPCSRNALKPECGIETVQRSICASMRCAVGMLLSPNVGLKLSIKRRSKARLIGRNALKPE